MKIQPLKLINLLMQVVDKVLKCPFSIVAPSSQLWPTRREKQEKTEALL